MVSDKLNRNVPPGQPVAISQYDMLVTQFGFIGLVILFPERYGIKWRQHDLNCFLHLWRLIVHLLGVDEKYNLCSRSIDEVKQMCQQIFELEIKVSFEKARAGDFKCNKMGQGIIESIRPYIPLICWEAFIKHLADVMDTSEKDVKLTAKKQVVYVLMNFTLVNVIRHSVLGYPLNFLLRKAIRKAHRKKKQISTHLDVKYSMFEI